MTLIREERQRLKMTQGAFARLTNLDRSNLSKLETGANKAGEIVQTRIADALGLEPSDLFDSAGWPLAAEAASA